MDMKKIYLKNILAAVLLLCCATSCLFKNDDVFDETASARISILMQKTSEAIKRHPEGFVLQYFGKEGLGGYNYIVRFADGKAFISCETAESDRVDECLYDILKEDGAVLSFNTYSELLQHFHEPSFSDVDGAGGDYEFRIEGVDEDDTIRLKGKIGSSRMQMFPIPSGFTPAGWLDAVKAMERQWEGDFYIYSNNYERLGSCIGNLGGKVLCIKEGMYPNANSFDYKRSAVYTPEGFRLQTKLDIDGYYGQEFILKDGEFVSTDGTLIFASKELNAPEYEAMAGPWILSYNNYFGKYFAKVINISTSKDGETLYISNLFSSKELDNVKLKYANGKLELHPQYLGKYEGYFVWGLLFDTKQSTVLWDEQTCTRGVFTRENNRDVFFFSDCSTAVGDYSADGLILYEFSSETPSTNTQISNLDILTEICIYR